MVPSSFSSVFTFIFVSRSRKCETELVRTYKMVESDFAASTVKDWMTNLPISHLLCILSLATALYR